ncbi:MAG: HzsA-related protein, partial [Planctomycetota bacterium]
MDRPTLGMLATAAVAVALLGPVASGAGTPATIEVSANKRVAVGKFGPGAPIHTNRNYAYGSIPKEIRGLQYTLHEHKGAGTLSCKVKSAGLLYLCLEGGTPDAVTPDGGWKRTRISIPMAGHAGSWTVYVKQVEAGERMVFLSRSKWGSVLLAKKIEGLKERSTRKVASSGKARAVSAGKGEFEDLRGQIGNRGYWKSSRIKDQVYRNDALILESDKTPVDVILRRTAALMSDIRLMSGAPDFAKEAALLTELRAANTEGLSSEKQEALFEKVKALRRRIAFKNPLIDFDKIVFIKHNRAGANHMCDQYHGHKNRRGGGLFVLKNAFSDEPEVTNLLENSTVTNGRLKGKTLEGGSFISLELSYDAKTILFARTELAGRGFSKESCFHIFKVNADGSDLVQLTDGPWNEFDPCFLPSGRIVFISERIGGFGRCHGRPVPTYTLHSMLPDGSDIITLSWHDTNEWHPSVDNSGMIVYSRWDYVDRDSDIAHHIWHTFPDGRDPRSFHGNYPDKRELRPWMELSVRSIPDSRRYIATAAPHHGQAYGSLVSINVRRDDDRAMSQLKRITPEVLFPESERGKQAYGNPWPLNEDYYLCVYDPRGSNYGLYLVDSFGNKILLYRDPSIACLDPIPVKPRVRPPVIPSRTRQAKEDRLDGAVLSTGIVSVMNVYEAEFPFPEGTRIKELRIVNIFPKATPNVDRPNIGYAKQSLARGVLGTVPVEEDGSVHFRVPAGIDIYFQALDGNGMVVQTMRSGTYVHPGETLSCVGCHEVKSATP